MKKFMEVLERLPKEYGKIEKCGNVDNDTRKGIYLKISSGCIVRVYFVGFDKKDNNFIAEYVNP